MPMIIKNNVRYCSTGGDAESIVYNNTESGMEATNMQDAIDELNSNFESVLLWENQNPSSSFAEQSVNLKETLANYRFYEVAYIFSTATKYYRTTGKIPIEFDCVIDNTSNMNRFRLVVINSDKNSINFSDGHIFNDYKVNAKDNSTTIPLAIYGIK